MFSRSNVCVLILHPTIHFRLCPQRYSVLIFAMSDPTLWWNSHPQAYVMPKEHGLFKEVLETSQVEVHLN